jgi:phage anti-repressor protein
MQDSIKKIIEGVYFTAMRICQFFTLQNKDSAICQSIVHNFSYEKAKEVALTTDLIFFS